MKDDLALKQLAANLKKQRCYFSEEFRDQAGCPRRGNLGPEAGQGHEQFSNYNAERIAPELRL